MQWLDEKVLGNSLQQWLIAAAVVVLSYLAFWLTRRLVRYRLGALAARTEVQLAAMGSRLVAQTKAPFLLALAVYVGSLFVDLSGRVEAVVNSAIHITLLFQAALWGSTLLAVLLEAHQQRALQENPSALTSINIVGFVVRLLLWTTVALLALDNVGVDVTALVTGLGIGGVAVALAVQNILGDVFASLSIMMDKPFAVGDFLAIDGFLGNVEQIGLKTTRLRSLSGEQVVFSNSDLLASRIRNYGRMYERRVVLNLGVTYDTPRAKLRMIPDIVRQAVTTQDTIRFDRSHFLAFGDYALQFETVYYVLSSEYNVFMDRQQEILFAIHERFEQEGIEFAYPTQKLYLSGTPAAAGSC